MRHLKSGRKLNRTASHRKAMLANLAVSLLDKERITTTIVKAKELRSFVARLITYGKKGSLHAIRLAARKIKDRNVLNKLFNDIAPAYKDREGGYTRIVKIGRRKGDNSDMSIIELVGRKGDTVSKKKTKKKSTAKQAKAAKKTDQKETEEVTKEKTAKGKDELDGSDTKKTSKKVKGKAKTSGRTVDKDAKKSVKKSENSKSRDKNDPKKKSKKTSKSKE